MKIHHNVLLIVLYASIPKSNECLYGLINAHLLPYSIRIMPPHAITFLHVVYLSKNSGSG